MTAFLFSLYILSLIHSIDGHCKTNTKHAVVEKSVIWPGVATRSHCMTKCEIVGANVMHLSCVDGRIYACWNEVQQQGGDTGDAYSRWPTWKSVVTGQKVVTERLGDVAVLPAAEPCEIDDDKPYLFLDPDKPNKYIDNNKDANIRLYYEMKAMIKKPEYYWNYKNDDSKGKGLFVPNDAGGPYVLRWALDSDIYQGTGWVKRKDDKWFKEFSGPAMNTKNDNFKKPTMSKLKKSLSKLKKSMSKSKSTIVKYTFVKKSLGGVFKNQVAVLKPYEMKIIQQLFKLNKITQKSSHHVRDKSLTDTASFKGDLHSKPPPRQLKMELCTNDGGRPLTWDAYKSFLECKMKNVNGNLAACQSLPALSAIPHSDKKNHQFVASHVEENGYTICRYMIDPTPFTQTWGNKATIKWETVKLANPCKIYKLSTKDSKSPCFEEPQAGSTERKHFNEWFTTKLTKKEQDVYIKHGRWKAPQWKYSAMVYFDNNYMDYDYIDHMHTDYDLNSGNNEPMININGEVLFFIFVLTVIGCLGVIACFILGFIASNCLHKQINNL